MNDGYIDVKLAVKNKLLPSDWQLPEISEKDKHIIKMILNKRL